MTCGRCAGALRRGLGSNAASSPILEPSTNHAASRRGAKDKDIAKAGTAHKRRPSTVFVVTLRPRPGTDGVRALRTLLKVLGRYHRLQCVSVHEVRQ